MTSRKSPTWPSGFRTTAWERDAPNKVWGPNYCRDCRTNCIYYYYLKLVSTHYNREQSCLNPLGICKKSAKDAHGNQGQGFGCIPPSLRKFDTHLEVQACSPVELVSSLPLPTHSAQTCRHRCLGMAWASSDDNPHLRLSLLPFFPPTFRAHFTGVLRLSQASNCEYGRKKCPPRIESKYHTISLCPLNSTFLISHGQPQTEYSACREKRQSESSEQSESSREGSPPYQRV